YLQLKSNTFEKFLTGKSKTVIQNGQLETKQLRKLRLTVDQLEMRLRNQGVSKIQDVKTATIEPNGQLGYELQEDAKPLTIGDFKQLMQLYMPAVSQTNTSATNEKNQSASNSSSDIFQEINQNHKQNPKYLQ
ncbi:YetF domain-containing protein, partial [Priestia megaterium]